MPYTHYDDTISELQSTSMIITKHISNYHRTSIELLLKHFSNYCRIVIERTNFNPTYTH